jgi:hypothetical protein
VVDLSPDLQRQLFQEFPGQLVHDRLPFGIECGDGWYNLIRMFCEFVSTQKESTLQFSQIKEKFGGLRLYYTGDSSAEIEAAAWMAESLSYCTCECCGAPGKPNKAGWILTLCDACRFKN